MGIVSDFTAEFWALDRNVRSVDEIDFSMPADYTGTE